MGHWLRRGAEFRDCAVAPYWKKSLPPKECRLGHCRAANSGASSCFLERLADVLHFSLKRERRSRRPTDFVVQEQGSSSLSPRRCRAEHARADWGRRVWWRGQSVGKLIAFLRARAGNAVISMLLAADRIPKRTINGSTAIYRRHRKPREPATRRTMSSACPRRRIRPASHQRFRGISCKLVR